ncbi:D-alanyl-D-alanine carboxypeptidase/D-alanyl-D-alanine-endopeptidase [Oculatella sp. LEGE 06141]|uniref:D-alanyl-D-alanine carboxypeptidase/D-alanyl-D-alanine endopeptidase n=1 Tax=Oculatella sp. LEGE 06141 TaxID=1828648 RepID=UPI0018812B23|nr:D-alanyl-D-alanine carboxypeptidase/D-alanyl-D-alanine-endopeptidase [Oculatella sp. LEGE 06141]MBE9177752.1 D-alanyl-D-alanine carboxypeptidase/D-alanyl-D-alanine-endopeptidase [Oculatella sp. LEGE 06141]
MRSGLVLGALLVGVQWVGLSGLVRAQSDPAEPICASELSRSIEAIANRPAFQRARWGIFIQTAAPLSLRETLYSREGDRYFIPASTVKLLTTAAVLTRLGASFQIRTSIYAVDQPSGLTVLHLLGRGDPSITDLELQHLARQLRDRGITHIDRLILDHRYFRGDAIHPNWEWEDVQAGYGAPVTSLIVNENAIGFRLVPQAVGQPLRLVWDDPTAALDWRVDNQSITVEPPSSEWVEMSRGGTQPVLRVFGQLQTGSEPDSVSVAVPNPIHHFAQHVRRALVAVGIDVAQIQLEAETDQIPSREVAAIDSPPLATVLVDANQDSNNLYAEALLRQLGTATADSSTLNASLMTLEDTLTTLGVDAASYALVDGSGLSRHNLVSPEAVVQTLQVMSDSPNAAIYRDSLAIAGISGTLRNRFVDTPVQGNLHGKTGAMSGVAALSGYLQPTHYSPLVFSILVNQFEQPVREVRQAIDEMVLLLAQLRSC